MKARTHAPCPARPSRCAGFVRYDWMLLVALVVVILAVVLPKFLQHGWRQGLLALFSVWGLIIGGIALLVLLSWLRENVGRAGEGWPDRFLRGLGHLLRFLLFGVIAALLGVALIGEHGLGVRVENAVSAVCGLLGGLGGLFLRHRLGPPRFWVVFRRFGLALLGSFVGGILGILGPEKWGVTFGILIPLLVFAVLVAIGRIVPPREERPCEGESAADKWDLHE